MTIIQVPAPLIYTFRVVVTAAINYLLFILLPLLHALFGGEEIKKAVQLQSRRVITEIVKKEEEKKKKPKRRFREVNASRSKMNTGMMNMKFTPELGTIGGDGVAVASQEMEAIIFNEGETDENPIPTRIIPIRYPERARSLGIEGNLLIELVIGRDGKVESVEVLESPHESISAAARKIVMSWQFKPGKNKGIPVRIRARNLIEFKLDE